MSYPKRIMLEQKITDIARASIVAGKSVGMTTEIIAVCIARDIVRIIQNNYRRRVK